MAIIKSQDTDVDDSGINDFGITIVSDSEWSPKDLTVGGTYTEMNELYHAVQTLQHSLSVLFNGDLTSSVLSSRNPYTMTNAILISAAALAGGKFSTVIGGIFDSTGIEIPESFTANSIAEAVVERTGYGKMRRSW